MVREKLDMTPDYIIEYIETKYHINIAYNKPWNARMKALMKIFGDWNRHRKYSLYLDAMKVSNLGTITVHYLEPHAYSMA